MRALLPENGVCQDVCTFILVCLSSTCISTPCPCNLSISASSSAHGLTAVSMVRGSARSERVAHKDVRAGVVQDKVWRKCLEGSLKRGSQRRKVGLVRRSARKGDLRSGMVTKVLQVTAAVWRLKPIRNAGHARYVAGQANGHTTDHVALQNACSCFTEALACLCERILACQHPIE